MGSDFGQNYVISFKGVSQSTMSRAHSTLHGTQVKVGGSDKNNIEHSPRAKHF